MFTKFTRKKYLLQTGFSMLEAVVVVGVLLALAVGGFLAYGSIANDAKMAAVKSSASDVHTALLVAAGDGDPTTTHQKVIADWNGSTDKIRVQLASAVTVDQLCVEAIWTADETITAQNGYCPTPTPTASSTPVATTDFVLENPIQVYTADSQVVNYHVLAVNQQSGKVLMDQSFTAGNMAYLEDTVSVPTADMATSKPIYRVTVTVAGVAHSYTLNGDYYKDRNGEYFAQHIDAFLYGDEWSLEPGPW